MKNLVVLSGSGISAESGLATFRDSGGLWEGHNVYEVASPEGWAKNPEMVLKFYNERRKQALNAEPNMAHRKIAELEKFFNVSVITQNVDDLHEKAGSSKVLHLHGSLFQSRSTNNESVVFDQFEDINMGDVCPEGHQLRPNIVWFGESVPAMFEAAEIVSQAEVLLIVGTSLVVYPAAGLLQFVPEISTIYVIDPNRPMVNSGHSDIHFIQKKAGEGVREVAQILLSHLN